MFMYMLWVRKRGMEDTKSHWKKKEAISFLWTWPGHAREKKRVPNGTQYQPDKGDIGVRLLPTPSLWTVCAHWPP